jgi:hypothetical protein
MISVARRLCAPLLASLLGAGLLACSSSDSGASPGEFVDTVVVIELRSGAGLRGLTVTLRHVSDVTVLAIASADAPLATASCQANILDGETIASCASTTSFAAPLDAWRITMRHFSTQDVLDGITSLACEASDATGTTFAVACVAVR